MAKVIHSGSGPQEPDPSAKRRPNNIEWLNLIDLVEKDHYVEIIVQYPGGEVQLFRRWRSPKTNKQQRETHAAKEILNSFAPPEMADKMMGGESAAHSSDKRAHRNRKTRALGNKLRGEAKRRDEAKRKEL